MFAAAEHSWSAWDVFSGIFLGLYNLVSGWIAGIWRSGIDFSIFTIILIFLVTAIWLTSGFWAGSIAETRGHNPLLHVFLGFIIPGLYPVAIFYGLKQVIRKEEPVIDRPKSEAPKLRTKGGGIQFKTEEELEAERLAAEEAARLAAEAAAEEAAKASIWKKMTKKQGAPASTITPVDELPTRKTLDPDAVPSMEYFEQIAKNPNGTAAGPFILLLQDGTNLEVIRILHPLENLALIEVPGVKPGEPPRNLRLPYTRMKSIHYKDE